MTLGKTIGVLVAAAAIASPVAGAADPNAPTAFVPIGRCLGDLANPPTATVDADHRVILRTGWADARPEFVQAFLDAVTVTLFVNDQLIPDANSYFGPIGRDVHDPLIGPNWVSWWLYDTGIVLKKGKTMTVWLSEVLSTTIVGMGGHYSGEIFPRHLCTITAV